jgi:hypothetical protein
MISIKRVGLCVLLGVLAACQASVASEEARWQRNMQDVGRYQAKYTMAAGAINKAKSDAEIKYNAAKSSSGNAQIQEMAQANALVEPILRAIGDYDREAVRAESMVGTVPAASPILSQALAAAKGTLLSATGSDPNIVIGTFNTAREMLIPALKYADQVRSGQTGLTPPMIPTVPGMAPGMGVPPGTGIPPGTGMPGSGVPGDGMAPGAARGAGVPGAGMPGSGVPGDGMAPGAAPGAGVPGSGVPGAGVPGAGGPGGN